MEFEYTAQLPDDSAEAFEKLIEEIKKRDPEAFKEMKDGDVAVSAFNPKEYSGLRACAKKVADILDVDFESFKFKFDWDGSKCWITAELESDEFTFLWPGEIAEYVRKGFIFEFTRTTRGAINLTVSVPYGVYQPTEDVTKFSPVYKEFVSKSVDKVMSLAVRHGLDDLTEGDLQSLALFFGHAAYICEFEEKAHIFVDYDEKNNAASVAADVSSFTLQEISPHLTELFDMSDIVAVTSNGSNEAMTAVFCHEL